MKQKKRINPALHYDGADGSPVFLFPIRFHFCRVYFTALRTGKGMETWNFVGCEIICIFFRTKMLDIRICSRLNLQYAQRYL